MTQRALVGATVIDATGRPPIRNATVLIEDDRIRSVTPANASDIPSTAEVLDVAGRYVIPGLMDANVHLYFPTPDSALRYEHRYTDLVLEAAQVMLAAGITTVFDTWGPLKPLTAVRDRIARHEVVGSRIYCAGNIIGLGGPLSADFFSPRDVLGANTVARINQQWEQGVGPELMVLEPEEVQRRVRNYIELSDIDFVKYAASGHKGFSPFIVFSEVVQRIIVEEAHRAGMTVQAHTTTPESLRMEIGAGADLLQHGDLTGARPMPEESLTAIVNADLPVAALVVTDRHLAWIEAHESQATLDKYRIKDDNDRRLIAAGAKMLLTTDGFIADDNMLHHPQMKALLRGSDDSPIVLGDSHFLWLQAVVQRGMDPMRALQAATRDVAKAYGRDADLGTVEPGKRADLVVLEADPLANVRNYRRIASVLMDGVLIERDALPQNRVLTTA